MLTPSEIEKINQYKYQQEYTIDDINPSFDIDSQDYFSKLTQIRLSLINEYAKGKTVLDIGCAAGAYLFKIKDVIKSGVGVDYSNQFINEALSKRALDKISNLDFLVANARELPFTDKTFDFIFSYGTLYYITNVEEAIKEANRLLEDGAIAIFEFGNSKSLNMFVSNSYKDLAITCGLTCGQIRKILAKSNFEIISWRSFQILPMWGNKPRWLKLLLNKRWKIILEKEFNGKMIDEKISGLPILRNYAFRHIVICKKI